MAKTISLAWEGAAAAAALAIARAWLGTIAAAVAAATEATAGTALATALTISGAAAGSLSTAARTTAIVTDFCSLALASVTNLAAWAGKSDRATLLNVSLSAVAWSAYMTDVDERASPSPNAPIMVVYLVFIWQKNYPASGLD